MGNETKGLKSLEELETERKTVKNKSRIMYICGGVLGIIGLVLVFFGFFLGTILFIPCMILCIVAASQERSFKKKFKDIIVKKLIRDELGVDAVYRPNGGISMDEINSLRVAAVPDRYTQEDYISCSYNGIPYEMCDCVMQERVVTRDAHGNTQTSYETYFKGRIIKIDFKRDLNIELKVVNGASRGFQGRPLTNFDTEVIEFNKKFKCYASSKEDGFYILTPVMIQKMLELEGMYAGGICFIVMHGNFYILINNSGDSLEVNISKPLDEKQLNRIRADIMIGASIINEFNIDSDKFNVNRKI